MTGRLIRFVFVMLLCCLGGCESPAPEVSPLLQPTPLELAELREEFRKRVDRVGDGIWLAVGYGLANSILIEGRDGLIVIDTMETMETGAEVAAAFKGLSDKPLAAIIYTHNHADHVFGAQAFVDALSQPGHPVDVFAHASTADYVHRIVSEYRPIISARSYRMFGTHLQSDEFDNDGIGMELKINESSEFGFVRPTRTFDDELSVTVAGTTLRLLHAPGETNDQIFVWLEAHQALAIGDNLYRAFPNLYTIRGTPHRSLKRWASSLDLARTLPVDILLPSHGSAIHGRDAVWQTLTDYRDAIRFVHDQTVRHMNLGFTANETVQVIRLPEHLRRSPYLRELYGKVEWSVRAVYAGNLGWFDGNPTNLRPLSPREHAERMAQLAGGFDGLVRALGQARSEGRHQWVLELSDVILRLDPAHEAARAARIDALTARGTAATNPNERHYYLSSALELSDSVRFAPLSTSSDALLNELPMSTLFDSLSVNLRAEDALETDLKVGLTFTDTQEDWTLWVRKGVLEVRRDRMQGLDIRAEVESLQFKKLLAGQRGPVAALVSDFEFPVGNALQFAGFLKLFTPGRAAPEPAPFATVDCCG